MRGALARPALLAAPVLGALAACATTAEAPERPAACAAATFPGDRFVAPAFTDKFNGRYVASDGRIRDVWRRDERLFIGPPGGPWRQLQRTSEIPGEGQFRDGCGAAYRFVLPPDGPGGWLTVTEPDGARSDWHRPVG